MKRYRIYRVAWILAVGILLASASVAHAGTLYYTCASGNNKGWDQGTILDWSTTGSSPWGTVWSDGNDANFAGTAGTVAVTGTINSVNSITFAKTSYTLSGGVINLTGTGGVISTGTGAYNDTISSSITGSVGLTKGGTSGSSSVTLTGTNSYTGGTTINAGTLNVGSNGGTGGTLGSGDINNSGTLLFGTSTPINVSDAIYGGGKLKVQFGSVTLSNPANTYSGVTAVVGNGTAPQLTFSSA